tara:strand:- start:619 stop:861 length:243 start_codon:yes stop_codon:yes gene_type:complete
MSKVDNRETFEIGDLVEFSGPLRRDIKNQIGVVIRDSMISGIDDELLSQEDWYVVQFGTMKLIVNDAMIEKIESNTLSNE